MKYIRGQRRPKDMQYFMQLQMLIGNNTPSYAFAEIDNTICLDGTEQPFKLGARTREWITEVGGLKMVSMNGYEGTFTADEVEIIFGYSLISMYAIEKRGLVADGEDRLLCEWLERLEAARSDRVYWFLD